VDALVLVTAADTVLAAAIDRVCAASSIARVVVAGRCRDSPQPAASVTATTNTLTDRAIAPVGGLIGVGLCSCTGTILEPLDCLR
jgi:hypothetical protein